MLHDMLHWSAGDWLAFLAAAGIVAGGVATFLTLVINRIFDLLGTIQLRAQQQQLSRQQADMADHQKALAGAIDGGLNGRIGAAVAAGLTANKAGSEPEAAGLLAARAAGGADPHVGAIAAQAPGTPARVTGEPPPGVH